MIYLIGGNNPEHSIIQLNFISEFNLNPDDYVILLGNIGYQNEGTLDKLKTFPFKILFLEGLSDNTKELYKMEEIDWMGGKIHKLADNVYHLCRCNLFNINNKYIFVAGGDVTYDKEFLRCGIDFYDEECPSNKELLEASELLNSSDVVVNYVLTTIPDSKTMLLYDSKLYPSDYSNWLFEVSNKTVYDRWYFGKYNEVLDKDFDKITGIGDGIIPLGYSVEDIKKMHNV